MAKQPVISIITVALNGEAHIYRALESVAKQAPQALSQIEHWLIDGASEDKTLEIAWQFPHLKINSEKDSGISDAFNRGVKLATGKWILFLNADDALADDKVLNDILNVLKKIKDPKIQVVYGRLQILDPQTLTPIKTVGQDRAWRFLSQRMTLPHPAIFISKRYFETFGHFDTHFKIAMDYELLLRGYKKIKFKFTDRVITQFSAGGLSVTKAGWKQASECLRAKIKTKTGAWPERLFWWSYQGLRWTLERKTKQVPIIGLSLRHLAKLVDRGF